MTLREAIRSHTRSYMPIATAAQLAAYDCGCSEADARSVAENMVAIGELVYKDPRRPNRVRAVGRRSP